MGAKRKLSHQKIQREHIGGAQDGRHSCRYWLGKGTGKQELWPMLAEH